MDKRRKKNIISRCYAVFIIPGNKKCFPVLVLATLFNPQNSIYVKRLKEMGAKIKIEKVELLVKKEPTNG